LNELVTDIQSESGGLTAIWIKRLADPMDTVETERITAGQGIVGNTDPAGRGDRGNCSL
jgi:hypothetical protein